MSIYPGRTREDSLVAFFVLTFAITWGMAVLLVLFRIIDIPTDGDVPDQIDLSRKIGIFLALIGAAAVAYGGWRTNTETPGDRMTRATDPPPTPAA